MAILYAILQLCFIFMYFNLSYLQKTNLLEENLIYDETDDREDAVSKKSETDFENPNVCSTYKNTSMNNLYAGESYSEKSASEKITYVSLNT